MNSFIRLDKYNIPVGIKTVFITFRLAVCIDALENHHNCAVKHNARKQKMHCKIIITMQLTQQNKTIYTRQQNGQQVKKRKLIGENKKKIFFFFFE